MAPQGAVQVLCRAGVSLSLPQEGRPSMRSMCFAQLLHLLAVAVLQLLCLALHTPKHPGAVEKGDACFQELISCEQLHRQ